MQSERVVANETRLVDTKGVRRKTAPVIKAHTKASLTNARAALSSAEASRHAIAELDGDVYAQSSRRPRNSRWATLQKLARGAVPAFEVLPLTRAKVRLLGAAFKAGGYRSGGEYLKVAKSKHLQSGHHWDTVLQAVLADTNRSLARGLGAVERAADFDLCGLAGEGRELPGLNAEGPRRPVAVGVCLALWLLRGLEGASLLGEQATVSEASAWATLDLGPTKTDTRGTGCRRTLSCACAGPSAHCLEPVALCPVAALEAVLRDRAILGLEGKDPLFPRKDGRATTARGVCGALSAVLKKNVTEHSFRRTGAKFYAARGVSEPHICYLGRWGSSAVRSYIEEAIGNQAVAAARLATSGVEWNPMALAALERKGLEKAEELLRASEKLRAAGAQEDAETLLLRAADTAAEVVERALGEAELRWRRAEENRVGAVKSTARGNQGETHRVLVGDGALEPALWVTACGWHFGARRHQRLSSTAVTCDHCRAKSQEGASR